MELTKKMKSMLRKWGYREEDFQQIGRAADITVYERDGKALEPDKAKWLLGEAKWLSGIARSAFHVTSYRVDRYKKGIYFDSSKLFC